MAAVDIAGFVADLKSHAMDHAFHVHDERHFIETYSLSQMFEIDVHPEQTCGGALDLHMALDVDPRVILDFEDHVRDLPADVEGPDDVFGLTLGFNWGLPPLEHQPDLLVLATELAGVGGMKFPVEVSAIDSFGAVTDAAERRVVVVGRIGISLTDIFMGNEQLCEELDLAHDVSIYLNDLLVT